MYSLNKMVWAVMNPMAIGLGLLALGVICGRVSGKLGKGLLAAGIVWTWAFGSNFGTWVLGMPLERDYEPRDAAEYPVADAIADFGGGVGRGTGDMKCAELFPAADRAYFAAELWKAGKAPVVIPSGELVEGADSRFMMDLGVPEKAIVIEDKARNTEENAKRVAELLGDGKRVLVVTSAWHMKRSMQMMAKYAPRIEAIPAPCDFIAKRYCGKGFRLSMLKPNPDAFSANAILFHEWIGYWGYRWFR